MVSNTRKALSPYLMLSYLFGLAVLDHPTYRQWPYVRYLFTLVKWAINSAAIFYTVFFTIKFSHALTITSMIIIYLNTLMSVACTISTINYKQEFKKCLERLDIIDNTFEVFNISNEYKRIHEEALKYVKLWLLAFGVILILDSIWFAGISKLVDAIIETIVLDYSFHRNNAMSFLYWSLLRFMELKFDSMNGLIDKLAENRMNGRGWLKKNYLAMPNHANRNNLNEIMRLVWTLIQVHLELCNVARKLHSMFELHMFLDMVENFSFLIAVIIFTYNNPVHSNLYTSHQIRDVIIMYIWASLAIIKIIGLNGACDNISHKASETKWKIEKLLNTMSNIETRKDFVQFLMQILRNPLKFSGIGFCDFGSNFVRKLSLTLSTFLIVLLQINHLPILRYNFQQESNDTKTE